MLITQNFNVSNEESATNNSNIETANTAPNDPPPSLMTASTAHLIISIVPMNEELL
jgi:hypothetical protein